MSLPAMPGPAASERDAAAGRLAAAYADGQLTREELDERLGLVLAAASHDVIDAALAGLPTPSAPRALEITAINGRIRRDGTWSVPAAIRITSEFGKVRLDLSRARFESPVIDLELGLTFGRALIVVPAGAVVDVDGLRTDWKQPRVDKARSVAGGPLIRISGRMEYGRLTVRRRGR